jgi:hypothetical protein
MGKMKMSSDTSLTPFLKWGDYKSSDEKNPDVIEMLIVESEPFETTYSTNIKAEIKSKENNGLFIIPLHNFESANKGLLNEFSKMWKSRKIKDGSKIIVKVWLGISTRNTDKKLRRWKISSTS